VGKHPNSNIQAPKNIQASSTKPSAAAAGFDAWMLEFGAWSFFKICHGTQ
jgi:hypothetical protein